MRAKKVENRSGLGKKSSLLLSALAEQNKAIFTVDDAVVIMGEKRSSITKLLHDLMKKKWLFRLSRGTYLILPLEAGVKPVFTDHEFILVANIIKPYYLSYWSALNYYGFTEQVSQTVFVATTKRKRNMEILGLKITFVTLKKAKFFGFRPVFINNMPVNIAEKEKAIVDCLDMPRNCGGIVEVMKAIGTNRDELNVRRMEKYAQRMKNGAIRNRLGYILELLGIPTKLTPTNYYVFLDPLIKKKIGYNARWKIIENVPKKDLLWGNMNDPSG